MQLNSSAFITDPTLVQAFQNRSSRIPCDQDRLLFFQGTDPVGLYILNGGSATVSKSGPDGEFDITLQTSMPCLIGLPSLMEGEPHSFSAVAHKGAKLSFISLYNFALMVEFDHFLAVRALRALAEEAGVTERVILDQLHVAARYAA